MALIASFTTVKPEIAATRTYEDFYKFLGARPAFLGVVSKMYEGLTASYLTEALMNIWYNDKKPNKFQQLNSLEFQWEVDVNFIKIVYLAAAPEGDGSNNSEIILAFTERYYEKFDTFRFEDSRQQCIVLSSPVRKSDNYWEYVCKLIDADYSSLLDSSAVSGAGTRFVSNIMPELHDQGYAKYQSNIEKHRNWITEHRVDVDWSSRFAILEDVFIKIAKGQDTGVYSEKIFKMNKKEQDALESFMLVRNQGLLWQKTTMDANGKSTIVDPSTGRPLIAGDGLIPQIERFASKYAYNTLSISIFNQAMDTMIEKALHDAGNTFMFICNHKMYNQVQNVLGEWMKQNKTAGTFLYSRAANAGGGGEVQVGATYTSYEYSGNKVVFRVDRTFSQEYVKGGYGVFIDLTADVASGSPAVEMFTLRGSEFLTNRLTGVGGQNGTTSGEIFSPVAGSKIINSGYAGIGVFSPYRSFILYQNY